MPITLPPHTALSNHRPLGIHLPLKHKVSDRTQELYLTRNFSELIISHEQRTSLLDAFEQ